MTTLGSLLEQLEHLNDEDTLYARQPWNNASDASVAEEGGEAAKEALAAGLEYFLEVSLARDVLQTWSSWRGNQIPTPTQACDAIVHYATHDAYLAP